jgi:hypothetical protein
MDTWYVLLPSANGEQPAGPFDLVALAAMIRAGTVTAETLVARVGAAAWTPARDEPALAEILAAARDKALTERLRAELPPAGGAADAAPSGTTRGPATPPTHAMPTAPATASAYGVPYSISAAFQLGWESFKAQWGPLTVCTLIFIGGWIALSIPGWIGQLLIMGTGGQQSTGSALLAVGGGLATCIGYAAQIFAGLPFAAGFYYCGVRAVRRELVPSDAFAGFRRYWAVLGISVLTAVMSSVVGIAVVVPAIIGAVVMAATDSGVALVVGLAVAAVAAIVVLCFLLVLLVMPPLIVVDPRMRAEWCPGSLSIAWEMGKRGNCASYLLLSVVLGLLVALSMLLLVVPFVLLGLPLAMAVVGAAYELMAAPIMSNPADPRRLRA